MLAPQSDANVLYGLMALQLGMISQGDLAGALAEWASTRARGLDAILLERGLIPPQTHALLEPLVLGRASSGVEAFAGSEAEPPGNGRWRTMAVETIGGTEPVFGPLPTASHPLSRGGHLSGRGRFRILRPHNEGGLGIISVARDEELGRQVALKEIKLRYADDPHSRARFLLEAEITGKLEHPGIVPIYGMGTSSDGLPYYAMRLIRGDTLAEAIDRLHKGGKSGFDPVRRSFSSRQLLERFLVACDTIEYAHSRGVIHRDIKPDNIMLGPYGETLVVDWGLARPLGEPLSASGASGEAPVKTDELHLPEEVEGAPTGTPRYMSPEQVRGELDRFGAPTDVYGLGATLYHLITGEAPLRGVHGTEVFRRVDQGKIPPPRAVNRRVPRALEAICRKAMAARPEDR
ncbi:serine/threonine-protein kinase [Tautonia sociabilis]|uniref:Serine/threonine protein kinase n=1 Tax=Tautonia sociabilis TaxID=2080755 RepID=A0A432MJK1_9BACT|nr:serine/threonine-protein kinase [Tautonia sociabilis]RUL87584.1 serine/threonine protein kinase [Tautonia sociabilis]